MSYTQLLTRKLSAPESLTAGVDESSAKRFLFLLRALAVSGAYDWTTHGIIDLGAVSISSNWSRSSQKITSASQTEPLPLADQRVCPARQCCWLGIAISYHS